jgi:hypothetical protein
MPDEITQKHLQRLRIRGAPATIPGSHGLVGAYDGEETWRQTCRALVLPLDRGFTGAQLREAFAKLAEVASRQKATLFEEPMFALKGDPNQDPPHKWEYEAVLPFRGAGKTDDGVSVARIQGGMHIASLTPRGLGDLKNLMRPYLLHEVVVGLDKADTHDDALVVAVYIPAGLSIKPVPIPGESAEV